MINVILERLFGLIKVVPIISVIFIISFQRQFNFLIQYLSFEDYIRILVSKIGIFAPIALLVMFFSLLLGHNKSNNRDVIVFHAWLTLFTVAIVASVCVIVSYYAYLMPTRFRELLSFEYTTNIYEAIQIISLLVMPAVWTCIRAHADREPGNFGARRVFDSKLDVGMVLIFALPALIDPMIINARINKQSLVDVEACSDNKTKKYLYYFNTSSGVILRDGREIVFINYDCLKSIVSPYAKAGD